MKYAVALLSAGLAAATPLQSRDGPGTDIVNGTAVGSPSTYPFIANMQSNGEFICGGTILSETKILTAAHCAVDGAASSFTFRVGSLKYQSGGQVVKVASKAVHPKYDAKTTDYDVAVLTLSDKLTFSSTIAAAKLVASGTEPPAGEDVTVIGWGATSDGGAVSDTLLEVSVPVVDHKECEKDYSGAQQSAITARMFCAASPGKDSCNGDSGGPIFDTASKTLVGGVSWGQGCADAKFPGIYADYANAELNSFIQQQVGGSGPTPTPTPSPSPSAHRRNLRAAEPRWV